MSNLLAQKEKQQESFYKSLQNASAQDRAVVAKENAAFANVARANKKNIRIKFN